MELVCLEQSKKRTEVIINKVEEGTWVSVFRDHNDITGIRGFERDCDR